MPTSVYLTHYDALVVYGDVALRADFEPGRYDEQSDAVCETGAANKKNIFNFLFLKISRGIVGYLSFFSNFANSFNNPGFTMVQKFFQFFKQPFPYFQKKWHVIVFVGISVFLSLCFLSLFLHFIRAPEQKSMFTLTRILLFPCGHTLIAMLCTAIVVYLLPLFNRHFFDERFWTKGKYFALALIVDLVIGMVNSLYMYFVLRPIFHYLNDPFYLYLLKAVKTALVVGILPTIVGYFWFKYHDLHSNLREKEDQYRKLTLRTRRKKSASDKKLITLSGNTKDSLTLFPDELFYIESVGNYVQVYYRQNGQTSQKMLRATLSQMEEFLIEYPFFVRCHRAFLVNTCHIRKNNGNTLRLKGLKTAIPVSKASKINVQKRINSDDDSSQI